MKRVGTIILALLALALDWGRSGALLPEARAGVGAPIPAAPHVRYYGLWDKSAHDLGREFSQTYIDATAPFSNVVFINPGSMDDLRKLVQFALRRDAKVIVSLSNYSGICGIPYPRASVEAYLAQVTEVMASYRDTLVAFFLEDEPYWLSYSSCGNRISPYPVIYGLKAEVAKTSTAENPSIYERLDHVAQTLHRLMPGVPVALNNSYVDADPDGWGAFGFDPAGRRCLGFLCSTRKLEIPPSVDWIGMDQYLDSAPPLRFGDVDLGFDPVRRRLDMLLANKTPAQRLFLIPDAVIHQKWDGSQLVDRVTEDQVVDRMQRFQAYAAAHPEVIGIFPYYYWTYHSLNPDGSLNTTELQQRGMQELPVVFGEHRRWGMQITGKDGRWIPDRGVRVFNIINQVLLQDDSPPAQR